MNVRSLLSKGISLRTQKTGWPKDGPLTPYFRELSRTTLDEISHITNSVGGGIRQALSPVGFDLARIFAGRSVRVLFVNTGGSGVAPWRNLIILDADYAGEGQIRSPASIAMVAHELTHLLQRAFNQPHYWPGGGLNPIFGRRWIGDSTNYMEVIAYLVGWTVQYDFTLARRSHPKISPERQASDDRLLTSIPDRLATLTGPDPRNACRLLLKLFPENSVYRQNFQVESRFPDGRIPPGPWHSWLRQMGFSRLAVDHIMILAARGQPLQTKLSA